MQLKLSSCSQLSIVACWSAGTIDIANWRSIATDYAEELSSSSSRHEQRDIPSRLTSTLHSLLRGGGRVCVHMSAFYDYCSPPEKRPASFTLERGNVFRAKTTPKISSQPIWNLYPLRFHLAVEGKAMTKNKLFVRSKSSLTAIIIIAFSYSNSGYVHKILDV